MPIYQGVDLDQDPTPLLPALQGWCSFVGMYSKVLTAQMKTALDQAGLKTLLIYEVGTSNSLQGEAKGRSDGLHFLQQCSQQGIRPGPLSAVFPTCDTDPSPEQLPAVGWYWYGFSAVVFPEGWQRMGGYAPGLVLKSLQSQGLVYPWSAGAKGWSGTRDFDLSGQWAVSQGPPTSGGTIWPSAQQLKLSDGTFVQPYHWPDIGAGNLGYDPNIATTLDWAL